MPNKRTEVLAWLAILGVGLGITALDPSLTLMLSFLIIYVTILLARLFVRLCIRIVKQYERVVLFRLGRYKGTRGPGMLIVLPIIDEAIPIDLRVQLEEVAHESCITKDNARIDVDFLFYWRVVNPELSITQIRRLEVAVRGLATGLLRAVIGDIDLDDALAKREHINTQLREKIDEQTEQWGIEVTTVEIREILMAPEIQEIMSRQMAAERSKRATILEAEGYREAAKLRAQGEADALRLLAEVASQIDERTLNIKYLEMLNRLGEGEATKYILPMDLMTVAQRLSGALNAPSGATAAGTGSTDEGSPRPDNPTPNDRTARPRTPTQAEAQATSWRTDHGRSPQDDNKTDRAEYPASDQSQRP